MKIFTSSTFIFLIYISSLIAQVTDVEGNNYGTVVIGNQEWLTENLKVSKYNDGTQIQNLSDATAWANDNVGAWAYYDNDSTNNDSYGKLYNGYVTDDSNTKNVCPTGWRVPSRADFNELVSFLGDTAVAGGKLKEAGNTHWMNPSNGSNSSGFTALPGGLRSAPMPSSNFNALGLGGGFWASDFHAGGQGGYWCMYLSSQDDSALVNFSNVNMGLSVRCMRGAASGIKNDRNTYDFKIFPNPSSDMIMITSENMEEVKGFDIAIRNELGQIAYSSTWNSETIMIDVSLWFKGVYFVSIIDRKEKSVELLKLIILN